MIILSYQDYKILEKAQTPNSLTDNEKKAVLLLQKIDTASGHKVHGDYSKNLKDKSVEGFKLMLDALIKKEPSVKDFVDLIHLKQTVDTLNDKIAIERGKTQPDNIKIKQLVAQLKAAQAKYQLTSTEYYKNKK